MTEKLDSYFKELKDKLQTVEDLHGEERKDVGRQILHEFEPIYRRLQKFRFLLSGLEEVDFPEVARDLKFVYGVGRENGPTEVAIACGDLKGLVNLELDCEQAFYCELLERYDANIYWPRSRKKKSSAQKRKTDDNSTKMFKRVVERICKKSPLKVSYWNDEEERCLNKFNECVHLLSEVQGRKSCEASDGSSYDLNGCLIIGAHLGDNNTSDKERNSK